MTNSQNIKAVCELPFLQGFARMCDDGWLQGWHERNGGNLTYRMTDEDIASCKAYLEEPREWVDMGVEANALGGSFFLSTGSGKFMRNVKDAPYENVGIVEINEAGSAYRVVWGLANDAKPTSEFPSHFMNHAVRAKATDGACRVIYHAHPANLIAMTAALPWDAKTLTRKFWQAMTECVVIFPDGVGVVDWMVPGGAEIAQATSELMKKYDAAIWALHGLFVSGPDFDTAFGLMHTIEKAAQIYILSCAANGGKDNFANKISDAGLRQTADEFGITINEEFLND